jgi:hypothetical protein
LNQEQVIEITMKVAISAAIQAYLNQSTASNPQLPANAINRWKLFTSTDYNVLRTSRANPWKNHTGFYE